MATEPSGVLLLDKPGGPTSRAVTEAVGRLLAPSRRRRRGGPRFRVGHAGTLDPLATGLLVILVGRGTRLQPFLQGLDKRYLTTVRFGVGTDSLDRDGEIDGLKPVPASPDGIAAALPDLTGDIMQQPPLISALKRDGRSLHTRVRRGENPAPPPPRPVRIMSLEICAIRWGEPPSADDPGLLPDDGLCYEVDLDIACGGGTYVRSLARDLAVAVGTLGHVHALRRLEVGPFSVTGAVLPDTLNDLPRPADRLLSLADGVPHLSPLLVSAARAELLRRGVQPEADWFTEPVPELFRLLTSDGSLVAVGRRDPVIGEPRTAAVFPAPDNDLREDDPCA